MQLQVSVELLTQFQGPERFYWPFAVLERLDLKTLMTLFLRYKDDLWSFFISGVRKHPRNLVLIRLRDQNRTAEVALGLGCL